MVIKHLVEIGLKWGLRTLTGKANMKRKEGGGEHVAVTTRGHYSRGETCCVVCEHRWPHLPLEGRRS